MTRFLTACLLYLALATGALAQCNGVFPASTLCGNNTGSPAIPGQFPASALTGLVGGSPGQVQFNNSGAFGGLTNTQLTADINAFTSGLSGAAPASGGGTTNFLRADGSWVAPPFVSSVTCGTLLTGGTITTTGTCAVLLTAIANSLGADVALNNTGTYFDGPSTAQGTIGTWFASGAVTISDTTQSNQTQCKLWDGTTVIASTRGQTPGASNPQTIALSGILTTPAGNIKISCNDINTTTGVLKFNASGNSKDSTLTVVRIQ